MKQEDEEKLQQILQYLPIKEGQFLDEQQSGHFPRQPKAAKRLCRWKDERNRLRLIWRRRRYEEQRSERRQTNCRMENKRRKALVRHRQGRGCD